MKLLLLLLLALPAHAQWRAPVTSSATGTFAGTEHAQAADAQAKFYNSKISPGNGYYVVGTYSEAKVDLAGKGGGAAGVFGLAMGVGAPGPGINDIVGVYGEAVKDGTMWAAGGHFECRARSGGGLCIGANIELFEPNAETWMIGLNINPTPEAQGVTGIQLQNPQTYLYGIDMANAPLKIGQRHNVAFCITFNEERQWLEFWRECGGPNPVRRGYIDMNFEAGDGRIN